MRIVIDIDDSNQAMPGDTPRPAPKPVAAEPATRAGSAADASSDADETSPSAASEAIDAGAAPPDLGPAAAPQPSRELLARAVALQALNAGPALVMSTTATSADEAPGGPLQPHRPQAAGSQAGPNWGAAAAPPPSGTFTSAGAARLG